MKRLIGVVGAIVPASHLCHAAPPSGSALPAPAIAVQAVSVTWGLASLDCSVGTFRLMNGVSITNNLDQKTLTGTVAIDGNPSAPTPYRVRAGVAGAGRTEVFYATTPHNFMSCQAPPPSVAVRGTGDAFEGQLVERSTMNYRAFKAFHHHEGAVPAGVQAVWMKSLTSDINCGEKVSFMARVRNDAAGAAHVRVRLVWPGFDRTLASVVPVSPAHVAHATTDIVIETGIPLDCTKAIPDVRYELSTTNSMPVATPSATIPVKAIYFKAHGLAPVPKN